MKKLYFYFWVSPDFEENIAVRVHEICLKRYLDKFDELNFIVAVDDYPNIGGDEMRAVRWLNGICGDRPYNMRLTDNIKIRESRVILEDLVPMIIKRDTDSIFLAHSKAITDVHMTTRNKYSVLRWVISLYYYSLEYEEEAMEKLNSAAMFGSLLTHWNHRNDANIKTHDCFYMGNFYWVNPSNIAAINRSDFERLKVSRFLHENFPFLIKRELLTSHNNICEENYIADMYQMRKDEWPRYLDYYGDSDMLFKIQNEIIAEVCGTEGY